VTAPRRRVATFLDRDGTLTHPWHYPSKPAHLVLYDDVAPPLRELQRRGVLLVVVTNQSGLARGIFSEAEFRIAQASLHRRLLALGVRLDAVYHCPHHPDGTVAALSVRCRCRKPEAGMLLRAAREHNIDLARSWMVGDFASDVEAGRRAGCRTVRIDRSTRSQPASEGLTMRSTAGALRQILRVLDRETARP
jgi:D-glycero-D-manno-heptose 1,7-bisphosphate phosphatase